MKIGIIGLGYVGLPLCLQFSKSGAQVLGFDVDFKKVESLNNGEMDELESARLCLEAHEKLVEADRENQAKFQDVISYLKNRVSGE